MASSPDRATLFLYGGLAVIATATLLDRGSVLVALSVAGFMAVVAWPRVFSWFVLLTALLGVILFVPIGRFSLQVVVLPFEMELYRLVVGLVLCLWLASLLVDESVRVRRTPFDTAVAIIALATTGSIAANLARVTPLTVAVLKSVTFLASFILLYYLIVSIVRDRHMVERMIGGVVLGVAVVSVGAIIEQRTHFNVFDHVSAALPLMHYDGPIAVERDGVVRAVASSAHPIALGVLFAMTIPLSLALAFSRSKWWATVTAVLALGVIASNSRTPILVAATAVLVLAFLRPADILRIAPMLAPLVLLAGILMPGTLSALVGAFTPPGGIVAEQTVSAPNSDPLLAGGRVRQIAPRLDEASRRPFLGEGFGTRQTGFENPLRNAPILDNQWLGLLLEVGIVGLLGWLLLVLGSARQLGRQSRLRSGSSGWLEAGLAASVTGFGVGMFTYDSLAFVQIAFVFWIVVALSASLLLSNEGHREPLVAYSASHCASGRSSNP